jgi:hypothetical protein
MRMLVGLGLASLLVWLVPMMFLSGKQAELISSVPPTGPAGGTPAVEGGVAPAGPIGQAEDLQAQNLMNNAIRVAQIWYAESGTYTGFGPAPAAEYEPAITFTTGSPAPGAVTMRVTSDTVVMVTLSGSGPLCAAATLDVVSLGRADASTPLQCQGGW